MIGKIDVVVLKPKCWTKVPAMEGPIKLLK